MRSPFSEAYTYAVNLLSRRDYTVQSFQQKLLSRDDIDSEIVAQVIEQLISENYLNDLRFAQNYTYSCYIKGRGPNYIMHKLHTKGVNMQTIEAAIDSQEYDWQHLAQDVARKKFGQLDKLTLADKAKLRRFLYNRGFK